MPVDGLVFREGERRTLEFVGAFDELYAKEPDPWGQSGSNGRPYEHIRRRLISILTPHIMRHKSQPDRGKLVGLEIGCGHGHVVNLLQKTFDVSWDGCDISPNAVAKAQDLYPDCMFHVNDITKSRTHDAYLSGWYNIVILGQALWYVMHRLDTVVCNCAELLAPDGILVISQEFLREQRYGREYVDGFEGLIKRFLVDYNRLFRIIGANYDDSNTFPHHDGLLVLRKRIR